MPNTHPLFDDITPVYEAGEDPISTRVTLVEMSNNTKVRQKFMGHLQSALNGQFEQAALTPMQGYVRHAIGCASERYVREILLLQGEANDEKWCHQLVKWGAISADVFPTDVFKRLLEHRLDKVATTADPKVFYLLMLQSQSQHLSQRLLARSCPQEQHWLYQPTQK